MESGEGFAGHGYGGLQDSASPFQLVEVVDCLSCALGTRVFAVAGALLAIFVGIKRKLLTPLVFFGTAGTMLDIIMCVSACEREHAERQMKLLEEQNSKADTTVTIENEM